jgi:organic radical activating enzyme
VIKSADEWADVDLKALSQQEHPVPTYLEVSFSNVCNMRCMYCSPEISSAIWAEFERYGPYPVKDSVGIDWYYQNERRPFKADETNPYLKYFDEWFAKIFPSLKVFRITGGEPLLSPQTFKTLDYLEKNKLPLLDFSLNSNLMLPLQTIKRTTEQLQRIAKNNGLKQVRLYTSVEAHGEQASWIRFGMDYDTLMENVKYVLENAPDVKLTFIATFNIFSLTTFHRYLQDVLEVKKKYIQKIEAEPRVMIDISYIRQPSYFSPNLATKDLRQNTAKCLELMHQYAEAPDRLWGFNAYERNKMQRLHDMLSEQDDEVNLVSKKTERNNLWLFIREYEKRKHLNAEEIFPEMKDFFGLIQRDEDK